MRNTENFAMVIGDVLAANASANGTTNGNKTIMRENIGMQLQDFVYFHYQHAL